ncbi:MAG: cyclic pyranopterin monophosphate synthase MoaC [Lentisphaerae bacterium]|nr:cyclic pyranopterin monophosphate synthase MoaC [Lentisphaerota bacterium]
MHGNWSREKRIAGNKLSHLSGKQRQARMVNVAGKPVTERRARAEAWVRVGGAIARKLRSQGALAKGNVLETARLAGIFAAKQTANLIPMCHPLTLDDIAVQAELKGPLVRIESRITCAGKTGVEMEAMTAAAVAALTVYDMCKSAGKGIMIERLRLLEKSGGKSGHWQAS